MLALVGGSLFLGWTAASRSLWYETTDYYCLWQGARLVASGADPYDDPTWAQATGGLHPDPSGGLQPSSCPGAYAYPLWTAVALVPFGLLPLPASATLWASLSLAAVAIGAIASWRASSGGWGAFPLFAAVVLTAEPLWLLVITGQLTGVMLGLVGISALWLSRGADARSGVAFSLLALKPQIVGLYGPLLLIRGLATRRRFAVFALAAFATMIAITLAVSPQWPLEWLDELVNRRLRVTGLLPTAWGLSEDLFGTVAVAPLLIAADIAVAWYLAHGRAGSIGFAAIALPLSLFAAPYAWSYDQLVLVLPWALVIVIAARAPRWRTALLLGTVLVASLLPWVLYALAFTRGEETLNAVVPALTALLVAAAIRIDRTSEVAPG